MTDQEMITELKARLAQGGYGHPEDYYSDRDALIALQARAAGQTPMQYAPMTYWFGRMSN